MGFSARDDGPDSRTHAFGNLCIGFAEPHKSVKGIQAMNGSDALTSCDGLEVGRSVPIFIYDDLRFGSFYVAEPESNHPAYYASLLRLLRRKGRSREDAEDLIQEAMLRLHLYAKSDVVVHEEAFLKHAVRNLAIDKYRHDRSRVYREVPIEDVDHQQTRIASSPTPDQILDCQQRLDQLTAILDSVSR